MVPHDDSVQFTILALTFILAVEFLWWQIGYKSVQGYSQLLCYTFKYNVKFIVNQSTIKMETGHLRLKRVGPKITLRAIRSPVNVVSVFLRS